MLKFALVSKPAATQILYYVKLQFLLPDPSNQPKNLCIIIAG